jgi:hypothetical protein
MPGLFDTGDKLDEVYINSKMPPSIQHLLALYKVIQSQFGSLVHRVLLCIDATSKLDERAKSIYNIAKIMIP